MSTEIVQAGHQLATVQSELTVEEMVAQAKKIQQVMAALMHEGEHFGVVPGTERKDKDGTDISKRSLYKAGAEKLCLMFRLDPQYKVERTYDGQHLDVLVTCTLYHIPSSNRIASGVGSCSTRESKYAFRKGGRSCPECGAEAIIKGKPQYAPKTPDYQNGGYVCFKSRGGCGSIWPDGAPEIEKQDVGRIANVDLADSYNTVVKMGCKRALVAAVLNGTAASDIFTQDINDPEDEDEDRQAPNQRAAESMNGKPAEPARDHLLDARTKSLQQMFAKKFGEHPREVRLRVAGRILKRDLASFNDITKDEFQVVMKEWAGLPDGSGVAEPIGPAPARPVQAVPATEGAVESGNDDLPFDESMADRILAAAKLAARSSDKGLVHVDLGVAGNLGTQKGWRNPADLVAEGVGAEILNYFTNMTAHAAAGGTR